MIIDIHRHDVRMQSRCQTLADARLAKLAARYPELTRVQVRLRHGAHHLHGDEKVSLLAGVPGRTLRAGKHDAHMIAALHAAFDALERELGRHHEHRRHSPR